MGRNRLRRGLIPLSAAILTALGVVAAVTPATAATPQAATTLSPGCIRINMIEDLVKLDANMTSNSVAFPPVGYMGIYFDRFTDPTGTQQLGTAAGHFDMIYQRPSDGHVIEYIAESASLADGTLSAEGPVDRYLVATGNWVINRAQGTSGRYFGMTGTWRWRVTSFSPPFPVQDDINLCPGLTTQP